MTRARGIAYGLAAAALFGVSAPVSKLLLSRSSPLVLSALLYLGAGLGLVLYQAGPGRLKQEREARLERRDVPWLLAISALGGGLGPVLMLIGLQQVSGVAGSLLLNLEAPLTMLLAVTVFKEHLSRGETIASFVIVAGALLLSYQPGQISAPWPGVAAIAGACLCWGLDNNFSQRLSGKDPVAVVQVKTLTAGTGTLLLAIATGHTLPSPTLTCAVLALGSMSYGLSLILDMHALRALGAAREAAFFATAPFIGAVVAVPLLGEHPGLMDVAAGVVMLAGVGLLLRARHSHLHVHDELEHDHLHVHDEHHQHAHQDAATEPHSHPHGHLRVTHDHPHVSDLHHRHRHDAVSLTARDPPRDAPAPKGRP